MTEVDREALGRMVRDEWIAWAREQPDPKPSWLVPWDDLPEPDREVDRRIGQRLYDQALEQMRAHADDESLNPEALWRQVDRQWSARYRADIRSRDQAITEAVADERQRIKDDIEREVSQWSDIPATGVDTIPQRVLVIDGLTIAYRIVAAGSVPVATPEREAAGVREEVNLADQFMPPSARMGDQEARRLGLMVTRPVTTPTQQAEQLGDPYSLGDWIDQTPAAPALLEPVADAIGQAMTTRQGPPEIAARALAAAAPAIAGMCHWVQNRGTARAETHQAFHYGSPCPYEAMATVLRGEPDPRDTAAEPAGEGMHHPVAALCHSLWCEQPHVTLRRGRHGDCTISTPHWHPPPAARPTFEQLLRDPAEQFDHRSELLPALLQHLASETGQPAGDPAASATGLPHWEHCSPALLSSGVDCGTTPRRPCACPSQGSHDHLVYPPAPGSLGYAQRIAEQRGDLADAADEDGMD